MESSWQQVLSKMGHDGAKMGHDGAKMGHDSVKMGHDSAKIGHDGAKMSILSSTWEVLGQFWQHLLHKFTILSKCQCPYNLKSVLGIRKTLSFDIVPTS